MTYFRYGTLGAAALACGLLAGCERPPVDTVQHGFRGTGMELVYNPRTLATQQALNTAPEPTPAASDDGPRAGEVYKNVKVLGDLSVAQFTRLMVAMTTWVSPEQGCGYCHNLENLADDSKYAKGVSRRMLQMTQHVNADWKQHVGDTGVTCFTCHRGQPQPRVVWFEPEEPWRNGAPFALGDDAGQNRPARNIGLASLPYDPYTPFLLGADSVRVITKTALPTGNRTSIKQTEWTYALMMHMTTSLGVNCTYCHNTRSFASWEGPPQRVNAWYGIRMARDLNANYVEPLAKVLPADHLGPLGDVGKVGCGTCHQGAYKPLWGASLLQDYPALAGPLKGGDRGPAAVAPALTPKAVVPIAAPAAVRADADAGPAVAAALATQVAVAPSGTVVPTLPVVRVLFRLDRDQIDPEARAAIESVADGRGRVNHNLDLAKQRAFAVRDALMAAGVPENRIILRKPELVVGTLDAEWRRVDVVPVR